MSTSNEFYDRLAQFYDIMNDWPSRLAYERTFLTHHLDAHGVRTVLDAACGTGQHTLALKEWGYLPTGVDASPLMIQRARQNAASRGIDVPFHIARFDELPHLFLSPFDAVICLGNSLPHVTSDDQLDRSLSGMANVLRPGGVLILHNLNYDRRWVERPRFFKLDSGVIEEQEVLVWRLADYEETSITFHTALFQREDEGKWTVEVQSTPQKPLFKIDMKRRLERLGWGNIEDYGNLAGDPFDPRSSDDLVLIATKRP